MGFLGRSRRRSMHSVVPIVAPGASKSQPFEAGRTHASGARWSILCARSWRAIVEGRAAVVSPDRHRDSLGRYRISSRSSRGVFLIRLSGCCRGPGRCLSGWLPFLGAFWSPINACARHGGMVVAPRRFVLCVGFGLITARCPPSGLAQARSSRGQCFAAVVFSALVCLVVAPPKVRGGVVRCDKLWSWRLSLCR